MKYVITTHALGHGKGIALYWGGNRRGPAELHGAGGDRNHNVWCAYAADAVHFEDVADAVACILLIGDPDVVVAEDS